MDPVSKQLDQFDEELTRAVCSYYILKTIHREMSRRPSIHGALNASSWAWSYILFSLQCSFFIQLERVFDGTSPHNADRVVEAAIDHARQTHPDKVPSLLRLKRRLRLYSSKVQPYRKIRHKVFAHPAHPDRAKIEKLFTETQVSEIETILRFLQRCVSSLRMYILNGHDIQLSKQRLPLKDNVVADTRRFLRELGRSTRQVHRTRLRPHR